MKTSSSRARVLACALLATTALASPALGQTSAPPAYRNLDANGVDLTHGDFVLSFIEGSIGSGEAELKLIRQGIDVAASGWDNISLNETLSSTGDQILTVYFPSRREEFVNGVSKHANGTSIAASGNGYVYRAADGSSISFDSIGASFSSGSCTPSATTTCRRLPSSISSPNGKSVELQWQEWALCSSGNNAVCAPASIRLAQVRNSFGYSIAFQYAADGAGGTGPAPDDWFRRTGASFHNDAAGGGAAMNVSYSYPASDIIDVTDTGGRTWRFTKNGSQVAIRRPGAATDTTVVTLGSGDAVTSVLNEGVTTNYSRTVSGATATTTVTNALSQQSIVTSDMTIGRPTSVKDPLNRTTSYQYDGSSRLTRVTAPEGNYIQYTLDARGNVTQTQAVAKSGSNLEAITTSSSFEATCTNPVTCNRPSSTTDARGNVTDYTYDPTHGGLLTVTLPSPTSGAVRPQARYGYTFTNGEYLLTSISACQTQASCAGTADEVKTTLAYDANGSVTSRSSGSGDGSLVAAETMAYDAVGNLLTVDGPLPGTADTVRHRYNAGRELVGTVSPDPDGAGAMKHRAIRKTFTHGLLTKTESGTVNSQSDADWAAFSPSQASETSYNGDGRPVTIKLTAAGTTYALTQTSYDSLGRPECTAQRMNPAGFDALPASACTLGTGGSYGPDRIAKTIYNAAGEIIKVQTGVGTAAVRDQVTNSYTNNGRVQSVTDPENNKTIYEYDAHDRLSTTYFPSSTKGAGTSSTTDYEQLGYDAASNTTLFRTRSGHWISYAYDALDRLTYKAGTEPDVGYGYDLLGRMISASADSFRLSFSYDALGRQLTETEDLGSPYETTIRSSYDIAGRRTRLEYPTGYFQVYPSGYFLDYDYLVTGEMAKIREYGHTSGIGVLATFGYDDLGRRASLTHGNGASTSYAYDPVSRLSQLSHDFFGTDYDLTLSYSYNPASQIISKTSSNHFYAWTGHRTGTVFFKSNGLNQVTSYSGDGITYPADANVITYDARGNATSDPHTGQRFYYNRENLLTEVSAPGSSWQRLRYDALRRLRASDAQFRHDGQQLIMERQGIEGEYTKLHVHGPGLDEPLMTLSYSESIFSAERQFLHADERGNIIAKSAQGGVTAGVNSFDENGKAGMQTDRFGYSGQPFDTASGLQYSRARMYNPRLGRFVQPDPIGYGDGMNMYAYVKGDPVNFKDPTGLSAEDEEIFVTGKRLDPPPIDAGVNIPDFGWDLRGLLNSLNETHYGGDGGSGGGKPDRCSSTSHKLGEMFGDLGETMTWVGLGASALGGPEFLPVAGLGGLISTVGDISSAYSGDPRAGRRLVVSSAFFGVGSIFVPRSIKNTLAEAVISQSLGKAAATAVDKGSKDACK